MKNRMLLLAMFVLPLTVQAGGSELHGGDSVVCFQNIAQKQQVEKILRQNKVANQMGYIRQDPFDDIDLNTVTVETLDIWETKNIGISPRAIVTIKNVEVGVKERLALVDTKLAFMAQEMRKAFDGFYAPSKWLASTTGIVEIDDSRELINYTKLCIPVQIAVQTNTRVYYDARLFARMNETNKTALVLHELLYSWLKKFSENSLNVRKYVGLMMLEDFASYPALDFYYEFTADYPNKGLYTKVLCPAKATVEGVEIGFDGVISGVNVLACKEKTAITEARYKNKKGDLALLSEKLGAEVTDVQLSSSTWNGDGLLLIGSAKLKDDQVFHVTETTTDFKIVTEYTDLPVVDGVVKGLPAQVSKIEILGQEIEIPADLNYETLPSGEKYLSWFDIRKDYILKSAGFRKMKKCAAGSRVALNPAGLVESCK